MSTITAILTPDSDGNLLLPLPEELRHAKVKVTATVEAVHEPPSKPTEEEVLAAFQFLQDQGTFKSITDTVAWQREIREDRPLHGRE